MSLDTETEIVSRLADRLAEIKHVSRAEAIKGALENELARVDERLPLRERLRPLQERVLLPDVKPTRHFTTRSTTTIRCSLTVRRS